MTAMQFQSTTYRPASSICKIVPDRSLIPAFYLRPLHECILIYVSGTITALVGVRVLNKTSDEYWFLMKINVTVDKGDLDMKGLQPILTDYFMMRLQISSR